MGCVRAAGQPRGRSTRWPSWVGAVSVWFVEANCGEGQPRGRSTRWPSWVGGVGLRALWSAPGAAPVRAPLPSAGAPAARLGAALACPHRPLLQPTLLLCAGYGPEESSTVFELVGAPVVCWSVVAGPGSLPAAARQAGRLAPPRPRSWRPAACALTSITPLPPHRTALCRRPTTTARRSTARAAPTRRWPSPRRWVLPPPAAACRLLPPAGGHLHAGGCWVARAGRVAGDAACCCAHAGAVLARRAASPRRRVLGGGRREGGREGRERLLPLLPRRSSPRRRVVGHEGAIGAAAADACCRLLLCQRHVPPAVVLAWLVCCLLLPPDALACVATATAAAE